MTTGAGKGTEKAKVSAPYFSIISITYSQTSPSITLRILSSTDWCLREARRISRTGFSAGTRADGVEDFWLIFSLAGVTMSQKSSVTQFANLVP